MVTVLLRVKMERFGISEEHTAMNTTESAYVFM